MSADKIFAREPKQKRQDKNNHLRCRPQIINALDVWHYQIIKAMNIRTVDKKLFRKNLEFWGEILKNPHIYLARSRNVNL